MENTSKKFKIASALTLVGVLSATALFLSLGAVRQIATEAKTPNKTLTISPSANIFSGTSLVTGSETNYKAGNASPAVFHEVVAATTEHTAILGTVFTTPDLVLPAPVPTTLTFPAPTLGTASDSYVARSAFAASIGNGSDSYYSATIDMEIGLKGFCAVIPTFSVDVSSLGLTENTNYTIENQSKITLYTSDYATAKDAALMQSGGEMTFDSALGYTWAYFHFYSELTILEGTATPSDTAIANSYLDLTNLSLAWSC